MNKRTHNWILIIVFLILLGNHISTFGTEKIRTVIIQQFSTEAKERAYPKYAELKKWPTEEEVIRFMAEPNDTEHSKLMCTRWMKLVLQERWIPADIKDKLVGLKRHPEKHDILLADYDIASYRFQIKDTSITLLIRISSSQFEEIVEDWESFSIGVIRTFLKQSDKVENFEKSHVYYLGDFARFDFQYLTPAWDDNDITRYWYDGNPTLWKEGQSILLKFSKLRDGEHPVDGEFGLKQRFPPFEGQLAYASIHELVALIIADRNPNDPDARAQSAIARRLLRQRPDSSEAIEPLIDGFDNAKKLSTKRSILDTMKGLSRLSSEPKTKDRIISFLKARLDAEGDESMKKCIERVLLSVLNNTKHQTENAPPGKEGEP